MSCPQEEERIGHKELIYNWDNAEDTIIICEGQTDVWRLGDGAVCTFGLTFTDAQVNLLKKKKYRYILFDNENRAQQRADELSRKLSFSRGTTEVLRYDFLGDPGDFSDEQVQQIRKEVFNL